MKNAGSARGTATSAPGRPPAFRTVLVEADAQFRAHLQMAIRESRRFSCSGAYETPREALAGVAGLRPDVLIMGSPCEGTLVTETVQRVRGLNPAVKLVMLGAAAVGLAGLMEALGAGADAYLELPVSAQECLDALERVMAGAVVLVGLGAKKLLERYRSERPLNAPAALTPQECVVLELMAEGLTNPEIAADRGISKDTVHSHVTRILEKSGAHTRAEAVARFLGQLVPERRPSRAGDLPTGRGGRRAGAPSDPCKGCVYSPSPSRSALPGP